MDNMQKFTVQKVQRQYMARVAFVCDISLLIYMTTNFLANLHGSKPLLDGVRSLKNAYG